ncbi:BGTF surface domain-containing protein [Halorientalis pallida]|uniref:BGTF surface domain-containing protein n=1 Tax=Halorientalis pallida TaxID=2479928 RepID=UPI003C6ED5B0
MTGQRYRSWTLTAFCCGLVVLALTVGTGAAATADGTDAVQADETDDVDAEIGNGGVVTTGQGGIVTVPINLTGTETATVNVGFNDVNFNLTFEVVNGDSDGRVRARINTFQMGQTNFSASVNETTAAAVTAVAEGDSIRNASMLPLGGEPGIVGPAEPTVYDVNVTYDGEELDVGTLQILGQGNVSAESWTLPDSRVGTLETASDVRAAVADGDLTRDESIARGDGVVFSVEDDSWEGVLTAATAGYDNDTAPTLAFRDLATGQPWTDGITETYRFSFSVVSAGLDTQQRVDVAGSIANDSLRVVPDVANSTLYVIADTDSLVFESGPSTIRETTYEANLTADVSPGDEGPNAAVDEFSVVGRQVAFDAATLDLDAEDDATVTGTTTVAPGTTLPARLNGTDTLQRSSTAVVGANGTFEAAFDLSDVTDDTSVRLSVPDVPRATLDGTVEAVDESGGMDGGGSGETTGTEATDSTDDDGMDDEATGVTTTEPVGTTEAPGGEATTTQATGPGFSATVAVLAVLGTIVLARRRAD